MEIKGPSKSSDFWMVGPYKRILTKDNLRKRGKFVVNGCPMCLKVVETVDHLILNCKNAQMIWKSVLSWFECCWVLPKTLLYLFKEWKTPTTVRGGKEFKDYLFL